MRGAVAMTVRRLRHLVLTTALLAIVAPSPSTSGTPNDTPIATSNVNVQTTTSHSPAPVAGSENARHVLDKVRPAIIQIKGFLGSNAAKSFHGTGFAVTDRGQFITNYHVVSEYVLHPTKYRLEYQTAHGKTGKITVLAVDVRHDLAVVQAEGIAPAPLRLLAATPAEGERAYAVGFPLDVGLTITEGVSDGKVKDSFEPRIHYSGAINSGMSGGPALNASGDVIGINVSGYRFQQLVSFLVPAAHAEALRNRTRVAPDVDEFKRDIQSQARAHSRELLGSFEGAIRTQSIAGYELPGKLASFIDCTGTGAPSVDQPVQTESINCAAKAGLDLERGLSGGDLKFVHTVLSTEKLDAWRFANKLSALTSMTGDNGSRKHVGPFVCQNDTLKLKGFDASVSVCARSYRRYEGLYDFTLRVTSLNHSKKGFATHLRMYGQEFAPGMAFIQRFVQSMEWKQ